MKKLFAISLVIFITSSLNSQWVLQTSGTGSDLFSASFPSASTGFACGYGNFLIKTTDGGANWIDISFPGTGSSLNTIFFVNENTGWLCSTDTLFYTTNCGVNWITKMTPVYGRELFFINPNTGWLNTGFLIYRTTNGGLNWNPTTFTSDGELFFVDSMTGWTSRYMTGNSTIYKTTDGGTNWLPQTTTTNSHNIYSFYFINANTGWASGYRETILKTTNGGENWVFQRDISGGQGLNSIWFINENTGWAVGVHAFDPRIVSTTNGGENWTAISLNGGDMSKVQFVNDSTGWAVGQYNSVFKTTNAGGITSVKSGSNSLPEKFALLQNYPNPFNPETKIRFRIPKSSDVRLTVFDILGRKVSTLVDEGLSPGTYEVKWNASDYSSGIYYYRIQAGDYSETKQMILVK